MERTIDAVKVDKTLERYKLTINESVNKPTVRKIFYQKGCLLLISGTFDQSKRGNKRNLNTKQKSVEYHLYNIE